MPIRFLATLTLIIVAGYGLIKAWPLLSGPELVLTSPTLGAVSPDGFITVSGKALHTQSLSLDGGPLLLDEQGNFSRTLLLPRGGVILSLTATDRFGRTTSKQPALLIE